MQKDGQLIFLSGIVPRPADSGPVPGVTQDDCGEVVSCDIAAQCHAVIANVRKVLQSACVLWDGLVDTGVE